MHLQTIFVLLAVLSVVVISSGVPLEEQTAVIESREKRSPIIGGLGGKLGRLGGKLGRLGGKLGRLAGKLGRLGRLGGRFLKRFSKKLLTGLKGKMTSLGSKLKKVWKKKWAKFIIQGAIATPILVFSSLRLAKALRCKKMARGLDDYMQYVYCQTAFVRKNFAENLGNKAEIVKAMDGQIKALSGTVMTHCKNARVNTNLKPCRYRRCAPTPSTYGDLSKYYQLGCLPLCDLENVDSRKSCRAKLKNLLKKFVEATKSLSDYVNEMRKEVERLSKLNKGVPGL